MSQETSDIGTLIIQQKKKKADSIRKKETKEERKEGRVEKKIQIISYGKKLLHRIRRKYIYLFVEN
jgi:hypothetical protein